MDHIDTSAIARRFTDALHAIEASTEATDGDGERDDTALAGMADLFAADATLRNATLQLAGDTLRGADGARRFWRDYAQAMRGASTRFHAETIGERAIGLFWTTTRAAGGDRPALSYDGATLLELDDRGAIRSFQGYYDTRAVSAPQH